MRISAPNVLKGKIKEHIEGDVNAKVVVELPDGTEITSIITKLASWDLELHKGDEVYVVIKASDVMIGKDH